jgi:hypothetical protein
MKKVNAIKQIIALGFLMKTIKSCPKELVLRGAIFSDFTNQRR